MQSDIEKKVLLAKVSVHQHYFKTRDKKAEKELVDKFGVDPSSIDVHKNTILKEDIKEIKKITNAIMPTVYYYTLPYRGGGWRLLTTKMYDRFAESMRKLNGDLTDALDKFLPNYDEHRKRAMYKLGGLGNEDDYPMPESIREKFSIDVSYENIPSSGDLRIELAQSELDAIKKQMEENTQKSLRAASDKLWARTVGILNNLKDRMVEYSNDLKDDSKNPKLFESVLENVKDLITLLPDMNVFNDPKLEEVRQGIEREFSQLTIDILKGSEAARLDTAKKAEDILKNIGDVI